jgi:hypothetical protein
VGGKSEIGDGSYGGVRYWDSEDGGAFGDVGETVFRDRETSGMSCWILAAELPSQYQYRCPQLGYESFG